MSIDDDLEKLIAAYAEELPRKIAPLVEAADDARQKLREGRPVEWKPLAKQAHTLAGSSGIYSFMAVSALCSLLEDAIDRQALQAESASIASAFLKDWSQALQENLLSREKEAAEKIKKTLQARFKEIALHKGEVA